MIQETSEEKQFHYFSTLVLTQVQSIEIYDFRILRSKFQPMMTWIARVSSSSTLDHINDLFQSHQRYKDSIKELIHFVRNYYILCALGFVIKCF